MGKLLDEIKNPTDLRKLKKNQLELLAHELRDFIITIIATKEGHLGASLGVVELSIALHYVFDTPNDKLIWDVGHQAYIHKVLTGRKAIFHTNRQLGGISGFPKRSESTFDDFGTGHSSTSISAILGMALASQLKGDYGKQHIAVIGDASIASGMAFEGLNHLGVTNANVLVILNDNAIGIDPSVGALKKYLTNVKKGIAKDENIFECLNLNYSGPIDGHDLQGLINELQRLKNLQGPRLLHISTTKGKGLKKAEEDQVRYHAPGKFDHITGELLKKEASPSPPKYQDVFGYTIIELAKKNKKIIGITPAMPTGSSLKFMMEEIPERAFDVGIAEQHAVTLAAGMASQGLIPFCNIYSTFLQRAYDQIIHDVALQNLPVIFCLDRAGLVGQDGPTHHGVFDLAYLRCIPNMTIFSPLNEMELRNMLFTAQKGLDGPLAIRYPRGYGVTLDWQKPFSTIALGTAKTVTLGKDIVFLTLGPMGNQIRTLFENYTEYAHLGHVDMRFLKPLDTHTLDAVFDRYDHVITVEDGSQLGGLYSAVLEYANEKEYRGKIKSFAVSDSFVEHGTLPELYSICKLDEAAMLTYLRHWV